MRLLEWVSLLWQDYPVQRVVEALIHRELEFTGPLDSAAMAN
jgi:hypothetical protein